MPFKYISVFISSGGVFRLSSLQFLNLLLSALRKRLLTFPTRFRNLRLLYIPRMCIHHQLVLHFSLTGSLKWHSIHEKHIAGKFPKLLPIRCIFTLSYGHEMAKQRSSFTALKETQREESFWFYPHARWNLILCQTSFGKFIISSAIILYTVRNHYLRSIVFSS